MARRSTASVVAFTCFLLLAQQAAAQEAGKAAAPAPAVPDLATYCSQKNGTLVATKDECIFVFEEYVQDLGLTLLGPDSLTGFPTVFKEGYDTACSFGTPSQGNGVCCSASCEVTKQAEPSPQPQASPKPGGAASASKPAWLVLSLMFGAALAWLALWQ